MSKYTEDDVAEFASDNIGKLCASISNGEKNREYEILNKMMAEVYADHDPDDVVDYISAVAVGVIAGEYFLGTLDD
jgi:hypothetical protein